MGDTQANLVALLGSRICHDLISPIGAINNGLELLAMTAQGSSSPEMLLIQDSCRSASARIRFFRVAFGMASNSQSMGPGELRSLLVDYTEGSRLSVDWMSQTPATRPEAQLALLAMLCLENALPFGGSIRIDESGGRWKLTGQAETVRYSDALWEVFSGGTREAAEEPSQVQFCLLHDYTTALGRTVEVTSSDQAMQLLV